MQGPNTERCGFGSLMPVSRAEGSTAGEIENERQCKRHIVPWPQRIAQICEDQSEGK